jgi:hypothetical protein
MAKWWERSEVYTLRRMVEERLEGLPPSKAQKGQSERATDFWLRVEQAGKLAKALALYDKLAAEKATWDSMRRETKKEFAERIEREGRREEVDQLRAKLLPSGLSQREAQEELVAQFQPLDGTATRYWPTPDPWQAGRLFRKKEDQARLIAEANPMDEEEEERKEMEDAERRLDCAKWRRDERNALAAAHRRARELKTARERSPASP